jgi:hypothetical protein
MNRGATVFGVRGGRNGIVRFVRKEVEQFEASRRAEAAA